MGLFDTLREPVFFKTDSSAERQLAALEELRQSAGGAVVDALEQEIRRVQAGISGEKQIHFELENSHIPMYVLHDLRLKYNGLTAQIDYLIITRKHQFVLECKNLYGDIEIDSKGNFTRLFSYGRYTKKEGVYSPVTQNQRHLDLIRALRGAERNNPLTRAAFEKYFYQNYRGVVVLANPKSVLKDRYAPKEIREQVIKADQLITYIKKVDAEPDAVSCGTKEMEKLARFFCERHQAETVDYAERYRNLLEEPASVADHKREAEANQKTADSDNAKQADGAVLCPKCGAAMVRRKGKYGEFWGCGSYPKCKYTRKVKKGLQPE